MAKKSTYLKKQELKEIEEVIELAEFLELEEVLELQGYLQTALDVELSTVPIYLYTYYSINRNPPFDDDINGPDKGAAGNTLATYANKAGAVIMSVVVEEMLHMSLAANILKAIGGTPKVYGQSPASFPTNLRYHKKLQRNGQPFSFGLEALSAGQLTKFLEIEKPEKKNAKPENKNWETLGQFYDYIIGQIKNVDPAVFANHAASQLQADHGYYAPNNVDTIYPKKAHWVEKKSNPDEKHPADATHKQAIFTNNAHSGGIRVITKIEDAVKAMQEIKHQGEGYSDQEVWDDRQDDEKTHYERFEELRVPLEDADNIEAQYLDQALYPSFVNNPTRASWSQATNGASDSVIDLVNAVYSYILLMTEVSYTLSGAAQHTFFYIGMHKGMIFILDKLIGNMRSASNYPIGFGGAGFVGLAPTFENYAFTSPAKANARAQLTALAATVNKSLPGVCDPNILQRINDLPDVNVDPKKPISFGSPA